MADTREVFEILEDPSGNGVATTQSQAGDNASGKNGMTVFNSQDPSGFLQLQKLNSSNQAEVEVKASTLPVGAATEATLATRASESTLSTVSTRIGDLTESAPGSDTASSGLNGRLQRIAQNISSMIAMVASAAHQLTQITSLQLLDDVPTGMNSAFSKGNPVMGQLDDTTPTDATENNCAPVRITAKRGLHINLRDVSGVEFGTATNPLYTSGNAEILSPLAAFVARSNKVLLAGQAIVDVYTMAQDIALVDFHFGGRGQGQAAIGRLDQSGTEQVPGGGFNSSSDVSMWTNAGAGSSSGLTWAYTTAQAFEGSGSATVTFTQSDNNNFPAIKYTWSSPKDVTNWRYINARGRVTVAAGGNQTRELQIILTDVNANTRLYKTAGTTTTAPFSTEQWVQVLGEIPIPFSETGVFDPFNVSSITLKLLDGGNKSGTIYWDDVKFMESFELIERIYIDANRTFQLTLNPSEIVMTGEKLAILYKNSDSAAKEYTVTAKGVIAP